MFAEFDRSKLLWTATLLGGVLCGGRAHATTLSLDTGKAVTVQQGTSGTFRFSATNDAGDISENFVGWTIGVQVLPSGVTTGTLTIASLAQPLVNPMPTGTVDITQPTLSTLALSGTINGSTQYWLTNITATEVLGSLTGNTSYNLGDLLFSASGNASGVWNVYAVQQGGSFLKTYWNDASLGDNAFSNLPIGSQGTNGSVLIGTITAVPEPSTIALLGMSVASAGWYAWRSRRKVTIETVEAT